MSFELLFTERAAAHLDALLVADASLAKRRKAVRKALGLLETNPRHPGLSTRKFSSIKGPGGADVLEAYAENQTPAAWRIFWHYGPDKKQITILAITPHP